VGRRAVRKNPKVCTLLAEVPVMRDSATETPMADAPVPAMYLRMSTEDQKYSIDNQEAVITEYARLNNHTIVETYADRGISGLDLKRRPALKALLNTVLVGSPSFNTILDVAIIILRTARIKRSIVPEAADLLIPLRLLRVNEGLLSSTRSCVG
jgi:predicted site-specific integrase-resolvase